MGVEAMAEITPAWLKRTVRTTGLILAVPGLIVAINLFCIAPLVLLGGRSDDVLAYGVISLTFTLLTLGAGLAAYWHAQRALNKKPSNPLRLPPPILFVGIFILLIEFGIISRMRLEFFFPPVLVLCAMLPPLWAVAWMTPAPPLKQTVETAPENPASEEGSATRYIMTWRRGLLALTGGATVSVFIAVVLEILLPFFVLSLVFNLGDAALGSIRSVLTALSNRDIADALTNQGFVFLFIQIAVIAPLVEELAKPLVTLPLLKNLNRQEAYWLGAMAGAGFAVLENIIYATSSLSLWAGIMLVRAIGSALHPLGSGLMAVGWRDVLRGEKDAATNWWRRFGIAVAMHAVWNGGSLLVITLGGAGFFGEMPGEIDLLGVSAASTTLAFLVVLGLSALWIGRAYGQDKPLLESQKGELADPRFISSDRAAAIWALACLAAILPAGIVGLLIWLR
jgi:RsiW-degrading membrane proteinase PrsW (M82 family)